MNSEKRKIVLLIVLLGIGFIVCVLLVTQFRYVGKNVRESTDEINRNARNHTADRPIAVLGEGYIGADACRDCHPDNFASWHDSYHHTMTQVAKADSVATTFKDVVLKFANSSVPKVTLRQDGENLWVEFEEQDSLGRPHIKRRPIVLMTGSHHAQGYWYPSGEGRDLMRFPFMYRIDQQRWITDRANFLISPGEHVLAHQTAIWNHLCDRCHTTRPQPRIESDGHYDTHVVDFGIACESCHGPGQLHADSVANGDDETVGIVNPRLLTPRKSAEVCGQCHSEVGFKTMDDYLNWVKKGDYYQPGDSLDEYVKIKHKDIHAFWHDGMVRISGREFNGLLGSPCFADDDPSRQMTCLSCHVMHQPTDDPRPREAWANDQLIFNMDSNRPGLHNNEACTQCHEEYVEEEKLVAHTNHAPTSSGSICYNCHMPNTTWGLMKAMRSHTISSPSAKESLNPIGRPNACNLCHLDKTLAWTANALHRQYDQPIPELDQEQAEIAASLLWGLKGDAAQRAIIAWNMSWLPAQAASGTYWMVPLLAQLLVDPYDAVRSRAYITLRSIPGYEEFDYDFLAPEADREAARSLVLKMWAAKAALPAGDQRAELLLNAEGGLNHLEFDRLLRWRDDRDVFLTE